MGAAIGLALNGDIMGATFVVVGSENTVGDNTGAIIVVSDLWLMLLTTELVVLLMAYHWVIHLEPCLEYYLEQEKVTLMSQDWEQCCKSLLKSSVKLYLVCLRAFWRCPGWSK